MEPIPQVSPSWSQIRWRNWSRWMPIPILLQRSKPSIQPCLRKSTFHESDRRIGWSCLLGWTSWLGTVRSSLRNSRFQQIPCRSTERMLRSYIWNRRFYRRSNITPEPYYLACGYALVWSTVLCFLLPSVASEVAVCPEVQYFQSICRCDTI